MHLNRTGFLRLSILLALLLCASGLLGALAGVAQPAGAAPKRTPTPIPTRTPTPLPTATSLPSCTASSSVIPSPNSTSYNQLNAVAVVAADDIWAVGSGNFKTLIEHWDGAAWSIVPSPSPGGVYNFLNGVAAITASDVWAVGYYDDETLIEHWDGATWSVVPSPNGTGQINQLTGVAAVSTNDVWAVGFSSSSTLTLHWNGTAWNIMPSPNPGTTNNFLYGVTALASNNVWAVGRRASSGSFPGTLTLRWDGTRWNVVPSPNQTLPSGQGVTNELRSVSAAAANDVWAVGGYGAQTLIEHWNGAAWSIIPSPNVADRQNFLTGVMAVAANTAWAVGYAQIVVTDPTGEYEEYFPDTLAMRWDGAVWRVVPSPNPSPVNYNVLNGVAVAPGGAAWAVGYYTNGSFETLVERFTCP
jgi:hypothetical protein